MLHELHELRTVGLVIVEIACRPLRRPNGFGIEYFFRKLASVIPNTLPVAVFFHILSNPIYILRFPKENTAIIRMNFECHPQSF